jgi:hypothetical protein
MEKGKGLRKWQEAQKKAHKTDKNARTFTKYQLNKRGWKYIDFESKKGFPRDGIIDMIAVKLDKQDHDKLKLILFQVKGGSAKIDKEQIVRLKNAVKKVEVTCNWSEKPGKSVEFAQPID